MGWRGRTIGVDLSDAMLDEATGRVAAHGWSNVELVTSDAPVYVFPSAVDRILSTFALTLVFHSSTRLKDWPEGRNGSG